MGVDEEEGLGPWLENCHYCNRFECDSLPCTELDMIGRIKDEADEIAHGVRQALAMYNAHDRNFYQTIDYSDIDALSMKLRSAYLDLERCIGLLNNIKREGK